ncbi:MAG: tRNA 2-thiouridine(34) synthase MnmA [Phycisphaerae bacterium]
MEWNDRKVVVAMSGGVDSSVTACLLQEQGYEVMGLFMRTGVKQPEPKVTCDPTAEPTRERRGCCSASDAADARFVAGQLGVPFYALNFEKDFDTLIDYFADEYAAGRTPNPCVVCNDHLKFGKILQYADAVGARYIATGHYARTGERDGHRTLMRGVDRKKDQSYVLFGIGRDVLDRVMFPIGELEKPEVREIAGRLDLPNRNKPDSVEICFAPDNDYARVVRERRPDAFSPGKVVDTEGNELGTHDGVGHFTIGQRRGLGIATGKPIYVTELNASSKTVTVGTGPSLLSETLVASRVNYLCAVGEGSFRADVKIRYLHDPAPATVHRISESQVRVEFDDAQRAITPGQAVVFYDGETVLGGGWIDHH